MARLLITNTPSIGQIVRKTICSLLTATEMLGKIQHSFLIKLSELKMEGDFCLMITNRYLKPVSVIFNAQGLFL